MKIMILIEDTCGNPACAYEHGLSVYVETEKHKILVDTGATAAFLENARILGIDLGQVDTVILSHGHYDHGGGIPAFATQNPHARIYLQREALGDYYHGNRYIGIDKKIAALPQVCLLEGGCRLDEELEIFSHVTGRRLWAKSNLSLKRRTGGLELQDQFQHEQCLAVRDGERTVLLSGCAHNGILNILDRYRELYGDMPRIVISGFRLMKKGDYSPEEEEDIRRTAEELARYDTLFCTGHCTGQAAFDLMKPIMGEKLIQIHSGMRIL